VSLAIFTVACVSDIHLSQPCGLRKLLAYNQVDGTIPEEIRMESVLVSTCLLGEPVRYDGGHKRCDSQVLHRWLREGRVVPVCPEIAGGLPVPRLPAEISNGTGGQNVLTGAARVKDSNGCDVSMAFVKGAEYSLALARSKSIRIAVLKEGSPSCGTSYTYDGTFSRTKVSTPGVTAFLLRQAGIHVFSEAQFIEADELLKLLDAGKVP
jgi:uncharacterized protein YbbK (DUF523 family)